MWWLMWFLCDGFCSVGFCGVEGENIWWIFGLDKRGDLVLRFMFVGIGVSFLCWVLVFGDVWWVVLVNLGFIFRCKYGFDYCMFVCERGFDI